MARTLQPEDRIARYRIVGPLGAGGMGEVYIARDETLDRSVALKILPPGLVRNDERVRRFVTEAKSASSLNHPNIVTIYEIGHDRVLPARGGGEAGSGSGAAGAEGEGAAEPVHYIAMELVAGDTLDQKIHQEKTDLRTLLGWIAQAAEGVAKAHAAGIVHRDLKPGNIMVSKDGFAKVLDFGLAKLTERGAVSDAERTSAPTEVAATGAGVVMGTVGYMSPEQVQAKQVDHRSDIFSLGCILYEAATRRRPFVADSDIEVMHLILKEKPPPIEEANVEVPGEVRRLIRRCLAKSPDQRFQSMKDLAIDLREAVEEWETLGTSTPSGRTAVSVSGPVAAGRSRAVNLAAVVAVVLGLAGGGFGLYAFLHRGAQGGAAEAGALQSLHISALLSRDDLTESALSADGRYLAYVTRGDRTFSLKVRQVRTGSDVVIVPESDRSLRGIAFSRDGDYLYYLNLDPDSPNYYALFQVPSLGGAPRKVLFDVDSAPTFSPDGKQACVRRGLITENADSLLIVDLDTMQERRLVRVEGEGINVPPAWSPDGKTIVAGVVDTRKGVKATINAFDVATGKRTTMGPADWIQISSLGWMPDGKSLLVSAFDIANGGAFQIYRVGWPGGESLRLTNDLDGYENISIASDGSATAIRRVRVNNLWVARPEAKEEPQAITFASGSADSIQWVQPLPQGAVAFTAPRDNKTFVWRVQADGSNRRQLTSQGVFVINVQYAAGAGLVFSQVDEARPLLAHVWRMDPDGAGLKRLTDGNGEELSSVSPRGDFFAYSPWGDPRRSLLIRKIEGGEPRRLEGGATEGGAQFSYDGRKVLYATLDQVQGRFFPRRHVMDLESGREETTFLLPAGAIEEQWVPDGRSVTYVDRSRGWNLMRKPLPDGEPVSMTSFTDGQVVDYTWSPDGSRLILHRRVGPRDSLWVLKTGTAQPTPVTEFKTGRVSSHTWAPDEPIFYFSYGNSTQDVVMLTGVK
ncbi:MAG TPA: protein kinase [Candidatus Polarisedimenticolia bacterium]|nr:protein kinase [Candidatus Polarisedimenticolia bacterium]